MLNGHAGHHGMGGSRLQCDRERDDDYTAAGAERTTET